MRVAVISGSWPPSVCGVGDYSAQLVDQLRREGVDAMRFMWPRWAWSQRTSLLDALEQLEADVFHLQYPTRGFGASRVPAWLAWKLRRRNLAITLHEYSAQVGPPLLGVVPRGLPYYWPFSLAAGIVFTNERERRRYVRIAPWAANRARVIAIGSNIAKGTMQRRRAAVVYFGQICPGKGIEHFIEAARYLRAMDAQLEPQIVGSVPAGAEDYARSVLPLLERCGIELIQAATATEVADRLSSCSFAFLPFPDGATEKRGSLLAALTNDLVVVTYHSPATPRWIRECTVGVAGPREAAEAVVRFLSSPQLREELMPRLRANLHRFDWAEIARAHVSLYKELISGARRPRLLHVPPG